MGGGGGGGIWVLFREEEFYLLLLFLILSWSPLLMVRSCVKVGSGFFYSFSYQEVY